MNAKARSFRVKINLSPLDFPSIVGLGEHKDVTITDPPVILNNKVLLKITRIFFLVETFANKQHEILRVQSIYEIPWSEIRTREDIYEFYKDATAGLNEAYQFAQKRIALPVVSFPTAPIETYQKEIDGVFFLLNSQN